MNICIHLRVHTCSTLFFYLHIHKAILLADLGLADAAKLSGLLSTYISSARSNGDVTGFDAYNSRLVQENYPPNTRKQKTHPIELEVLEEWARANLGNKSGQQTHEICFLYGPPDHFIEEVYIRRGCLPLSSFCFSCSLLFSFFVIFFVFYSFGRFVLSCCVHNSRAQRTSCRPRSGRTCSGLSAVLCSTISLSHC